MQISFSKNGNKNPYEYNSNGSTSGDKTHEYTFRTVAKPLIRQFYSNQCVHMCVCVCCDACSIYLNVCFECGKKEIQKKSNEDEIWYTRRTMNMKHHSNRTYTRGYILLYKISNVHLRSQWIFGSEFLLRLIRVDHGHFLRCLLSFAITTDVHGECI